MLPEKIDGVRDWLAHAAEDLQVAERFDSTQEFPRTVLFHSQQAAEKALKPFLVWHDRPFRATHDLLLPTRSCADIAADFATLEATARRLTPYAAGSRYPSRLSGPTRAQAAEGVRAAREVVAFVLDRLPPPVRL